jgi:hypothetical protein
MCPPIRGRNSSGHDGTTEREAAQEEAAQERQARKGIIHGLESEPLMAFLLAVAVFLCGMSADIHSRTSLVTHLTLDGAKIRSNLRFAYPQQADLMPTSTSRPITDSLYDSGFQNKTQGLVWKSGFSVPMWCFMRHTNGTVLRYLARAESREIDPWYRDDYRVASHTVRFAKRGIANPFERAFLHYFGKSIDKALVAWDERDERTQYELLCALPKKPVVRAELDVKISRRG